MASFRQELQEGLKPVSTKPQEDLAAEGESLIKNMRKYYGTGATPAVQANLFQKKAASQGANTADYERRKALVPKAYQAASQQDEGNAKIDDSVSQFYDEYLLKSDELKQKQTGSDMENSLFQQQHLYDMQNKIREIEFSGFKNQAQRMDAMEKAYLDGQLDIQMQNAAIEHAVTVSDMEQYWELQMNEVEQAFEDWRTQQGIDEKKFIEFMQSKAQNWGSIFNGLIQATAGTLDYADKKGAFD